jgi:alpha-1,2-mannosyltransferase
MRDNPFNVASLVMTNSRWTAKIVKMIYGEEPVIVNPPLPPNVEIVENPTPFDARNDAIVMVGRFTEEKRYQWVIQELLPRLKKIQRNVKLYIFGSTGVKAAEEYYDKLLILTKKSGFKVSTKLCGEADVYLVENAPRSVINDVMDKAKVFLHATINEHWGIAVAEAMARGLPVVVHKSGGTWSDLASEGLYGLGYTDAEEAAEAIAKLMTDSSMWDYYSKKSTERVRELIVNLLKNTRTY